MSEYIASLCRFLDNSPSPFHAVENLTARLREAGYTELKEAERWNLAAGGRYYVTRNRSSVVAFAVPEKGFAPFHIVASHSDSPVFKVKQDMEKDACGHYTMLNTEKYGGLIMSTWLDRPLTVAGRLLVKNEKGIETKLVYVDRDLLVIPNLAIHMNREANDGFKMNLQTDMLPLFGEEKADFMSLVAEAAGVKKEDIAGHDLFLVPRAHATTVGAKKEFVLSARLDDLECAYSSLEALLAAKVENCIPVMAVFDNEEVGSGTKQGALSTFLYDVLTRTSAALGADREDYLTAIASTFMLSADNAHAVHPNHPEKADPTHQPFMNKGIVVKFNANQKYTTDGVSCAVFTTICAKAGVPVQFFHNRSDMAGGSTLGNLANTHTSMNTVDIGLPQLAMHSCCETAGVQDLDYMVNGMKAFYEANICANADGAYDVK